MKLSSTASANGTKISRPKYRAAIATMTMTAVTKPGPVDLGLSEGAAAAGEGDVASTDTSISC